MAKKTNKTSHVMNLLTNGAAPEPETPAEASASTASSEASTGSTASDTASASGTDQEKKGDVQSHTVSPKKVTVVDEGSRNDRLSQEILNNLEKELEEEQNMENQGTETTQAEMMEQTETMEQANTPETETTPEESPAVSPAAPEPQKEQAAPTAPVSDAPAELGEAPAEPSAAEPEKAPSAAAQPKPALPKVQPYSKALPPQAAFLKSGADDNLINGEYRFVNIMEHLILRQDISSVLSQYNVCNCTRCMADVCALALTSLPPKYVVTSKDSLSPLLSYYESRNKIPMLTALIKACNQVRENPRHKR